MCPLVSLPADTSPEAGTLQVKWLRQAHRWLIALSVLFALACAACLPFSSTPTPIGGVVEFQVTVIYPTQVIRPATETATLTPSYTDTPLPSPTATPTDTATAAATGQTTQPEATPTGITLPSQPSTPASAQPAGGITLVELQNNISLPADVGRVEFKWVWDGHGCASPPDGQAFEIRIWPDLPGATPLGVMDASQPDAIFCDENNGTRSYEVGNLRGAPGVNSAVGGRFRWHVALVELGSQKMIAVSESRVFDLPPGAPTPTATPAPPRVALAPGQDAGVISLEQPQDNHSLPENTKLFEFKWRWNLAGACELPPHGYGFELRIWPDRPDFGPMGAMGDARTSQADIFCDASTGLFGYQVADLQETPAVKEAGAGRFRWDVVLVQLDPYDIVTLSRSRAFELPGQSKLE